MNYITDEVIRYLLLTETDYAIQINGEWGIGKTYYVSNELKLKVEKNDFKFCYVSLNGFSSVEEIGDAVFLELASKKNKLAVQGLKFISKYGSSAAKSLGLEETISNVSHDVEKNIMGSSTEDFSNVLICFDDLERIDDSLSLKQVFGYINTNYVEHNNLKVIFVSNQNKISNKDEYKNIREKIIGKTLDFKYDDHSVGSIIESIVCSKYKSQKLFSDFYKDNKKDLLRAINLIFDKMNLRTLRLSLDAFVILQCELFKYISEENRNALSNALFLNVLIVGNEFNNGRIEKFDDLSFIHNKNNVYITSLLDFQNEKENDDDARYPEQFMNRYHKHYFITDNVYYFPTVTNYIINGFIDCENFKEEILTLNKKRKIQYTNSSDPRNILRSFNRHSDCELQEAQDSVLAKVEKGLYSAEEYPNLYNLLVFFKDENLILTDKFDLEKVFQTGFNKALEKWEPTNLVDFWDINSETAKSQCKDMIKKLKNKAAFCDYTRRKNNVKNWIEDIINSKNTSEIYKEIKDERDFFEIFIELQEEEQYLTKHNIVIVELKSLIESKYPIVNNCYKAYSHEKPYVTELRSMVDDYIKQEEGKIKKYNLKKLTENLCAIERYLQKNQQ